MATDKNNINKPKSVRPYSNAENENNPCQQWRAKIQCSVSNFRHPKQNHCFYNV